MAILTNTGIIFGDSTQINSKYGIFPRFTPVLFYQAAAPTGWTTPATEYNDRALRIVNGSGANSGGVNAFTNTFSNKSISINSSVSITGLQVVGSTIDVNTMAQHAHYVNLGGNSNSASASPFGSSVKVSPGNTTGNNGGSGSHTHPISYSSANTSLSGSIDFSVQYINVIYCIFA